MKIRNYKGGVLQLHNPEDLFVQPIITKQYRSIVNQLTSFF